MPRCALMRLPKNRWARGQSIMEVVVGLIVLIPIILLAVDATFLLTANRANQELAHNIARSAANQRSADTAEQAARKTVDEYARTSMIESVTLSEFSFDTTSKIVTAGTLMKVGLPVPIPGISVVQLNAQWAEPIVALPAAR